MLVEPSSFFSKIAFPDSSIVLDVVNGVAHPRSAGVRDAAPGSTLAQRRHRRGAFSSVRVHRLRLSAAYARVHRMPCCRDTVGAGVAGLSWFV
jgi:hypothetical protein